MLPVSRPSAGGLGSAVDTQEFRYPSADCAVALREDLIEPENVTLEKPLEICRSWPGCREPCQKFTDEIHISAAR